MSPFSFIHVLCVLQGWFNKIPQTGALKQQKFVLITLDTRSWNPWSRASSETVSRIFLCLFLTSSGSCQPLAFFVLKLYDSEFCCCLYIMFLFAYSDISLIELKFCSVTSSQCAYIWKDPISKNKSHSQVMEVSISAHLSGGITQPVAPVIQIFFSSLFSII